MAAGLGGGGPLSGLRRPGRCASPVLCARHVPVPLGRSPPRPRRGVQRWRRRGPVPGHAGTQRAASDRLGLVRAPGGERGDQERDPPQAVDLREHRAAGALLQADGDVLRLEPPGADQRSRVLPLDPVAVPEALRHGIGVPEERSGQLVSERPDRPRERAGDQRLLRAVRDRGGPEGPHPVVLQDHRLRAAAARRRGHARGMAGASHHDAAELDRALRRSDRPVHGRGDR